MNRRTKLINEITDLILSKGLLNEIGEGTSTYPIKHEDVSPKGYLAEFDVTDEAGKVLDTIIVKAPIKRETVKNGLFTITVLTISFISKKALRSGTLSGSDNYYYYKTGTNRPLKILSTVTKCIIDFLNTPAGSEIQGIKVQGHGADSKEIYQKAAMYNQYLQKNLHSVKDRIFVKLSSELYNVLNTRITFIDAEIESEALAFLKADPVMEYIEESSDLLYSLAQGFKDSYDYEISELLKAKIALILSHFDKAPNVINRYIMDSSASSRYRVEFKSRFQDSGKLNTQEVIKWLTRQYIDLDKIRKAFLVQDSKSRKLDDRTMSRVGKILTLTISGIKTLQHILS